MQRATPRAVLGAAMIRVCEHSFGIALAADGSLHAGERQRTGDDQISTGDEFGWMDPPDTMVHAGRWDMYWSD